MKFTKLSKLVAASGLILASSVLLAKIVTAQVGTPGGLGATAIQEIKTADGTTDCFPSTIKVSNGTLTCAGGDPAVLTTGGGGGGSGSVNWDDDGALVVTGSEANFVDTDNTVVTNSPSGTARINLQKYALLPGRSGGQVLYGSPTASQNLTLVPNSAGTTGAVGFQDITKAQFSSNGFGSPRLIIGGNSDPTSVFLPGGILSFLVEADGDDARFAAYAAGTNHHPQFVFLQSNGTIASPSASSNGEQLSTLEFFGFDTTPQPTLSAGIAAAVEGTVGAGVVPGNLSFFAFDDTNTPHFLALHSNGRLENFNSTPDAALHIKPQSASTVDSIFQGVSSQTADLTQWKDSSGTVLSKVQPDGAIIVKNLVKISKDNAFGTDIGSITGLQENTLQVLNFNTSDTDTINGASAFYRALTVDFTGNPTNVDGAIYFGLWFPNTYNLDASTGEVHFYNVSTIVETLNIVDDTNPVTSALFLNGTTITSTANRTMEQATSFGSTPTYAMSAGNTLTITHADALHDFVTLNPTTSASSSVVLTEMNSVNSQLMFDIHDGASANVVLRRGLYMANKDDLSGVGTQGTVVGVDIDDQTVTGTAYSLRSVGAGVQMRHVGRAIFGANTAPNSNLQVTGSYAGSIKTITSADSPYTATDADYTIIANTSGGNITINLPATSGITGRIYNIKEISASNTLTIDPNASENIDGSTTKTINTQYQSVQIISDGTQWWII